MYSCSCLLKGLRRNAQLVAILVSIVIGLILGILIQRLALSDEALMWIGFPGEIFLRMFKACIIPLIVFGVISGASSVDPKSNGKAGAIALIYSMGLSVGSCFLGLLLCLAIKPGNFMQSGEIQQEPKTHMKTQDIFADLFRNLFTDNLVRATMQKARTDYMEKLEQSHDVHSANMTQNVTEGNVILSRTLVYANTTNLLGVLFFCIVFGLAIGRLGKKAAVIHDFAVAGTSVMILILQWFMWVCPIGVASLIITALAKQKELGVVMARLGMLMVTLGVGHVLQCLLVIPLIFFILTRRNPLQLVLKCGRVAAMAFATCSSILIMPEYYRICRHYGYDDQLTNMVVPLITTISSCGSALYVGAASLFLTQFSSINVNAGQMVVMGLLGAVSCFALPAAPSSSILIVMLILQTLSIPSEVAGILFSIDWLLDRIRSVTNSMSKAIGGALLNELCQKDLLAQVDDEPSEKPPNANTTLEMNNAECPEYDSLLSANHESPEKNHNV